MAERPTIILFSAFYDPWMSGAERCVQEVVERTQDRYHFVLFTSRLSRRVSARETRPFGEIRRLGVGLPIDKWLFCVLAPLAAFGVRARVAHAVMESYAGIALWLFGMLRPRVRRVLTLQSGDLDAAGKQRRIPGWLWRRIHRSPDVVTAISHFLAERARRLGADPARVEVIPNGVDVSRLHPAAPGERVANRVVCIARLSQEKGLSDLLAAAARLRADVPDAHLVLVGDGAQRAALEAQTRALGIADAVTFRGALPNAEALAVLRTAQVFACPSLAEGLGIVFLEAQGSGVAVVGTRVGGIPDVIADGATGLLVPPHDPQALAAALRRLLTDAALRERLAAAGRISAARFDWARIVPRYGELYNELVSPRVVIAASIYPPDVGGPARAAAQTFADLSRRGLAVTVIARGRKTDDDAVVRRRSHLGYIRAVYFAARRADAVYMQDASLSAWLALCAARRAGARVVTRLGGDLLWERSLDRGHAAMPLRTFYATGAWRRAPFLYQMLLRRVLRGSSLLVFNGPLLPELYREAGFPLRSWKVIVNPAPTKRPPVLEGWDRTIILPGRFAVLKNQESFLLAAENARRAGASFSVVLVGSGPLRRRLEHWREARRADWLTIRSAMSFSELHAAMAGALAVVIPSWSEVGPNTALEAIAAGAPLLLTRENGYREPLAPFVREIDPADREDMRAAILEVVSVEGNQRARIRAASFHWPQTAETMGEQLAMAIEGLCAS